MFSPPTNGSVARHLKRCRRSWRLTGTTALLLAMATMVLCPSPAYSIRPDDPEVQLLVTKGIGYLEQEIEQQYYAGPPHRVGLHALMGLVFVKTGRQEYPRVKNALQVCREAMDTGEEVDVYSNGLAVIFLCEYGADHYRKEIDYYLAKLAKRQKPHGGWGYDTSETGDTSQTQYGTFGYWQAAQHGFHPNRTSIEGVTRWLLRTQGPDGCWGYQGNLGTDTQLVAQSGTTVSMLAAGMGSLLITSDMLGIAPKQLPPRIEKAKAALSGAGLPVENRPVEVLDPASASALSQFRVDQAFRRADRWFHQNYTVDIGAYTAYYLYSLERYKSFEEHVTSTGEAEPKWYTDGFELLKKKQAPNGSWHFGLGNSVDTSFALLFLIRSTKRSITNVLSEGTLVGGRGLPSNVGRARIKDGQIIADQVKTTLDGLFTMIDSGEQGALDDLADDPSVLVVAEVDNASVRRLKQLVRGGEPTARLLAVRALARTGDLDHVPSLLYAMTDPDPKVVREARDGLEFVSRRFEGFGPPDNYDEDQRHDAIAKWKMWYQGVRPDASLEP